MKRTIAYWWDGVRVETEGTYDDMEPILSNLRCMGVRASWSRFIDPSQTDAEEIRDMGREDF